MITTKKILTLLVDDEAVFRKNLRTLLELYPMDFKIVGETGSTAKAINLINHYHPQLMLLDLELAQDSGLNILKYLQAHHLSVKTLVLSAHQEENLIFESMQAGAQGYIFKTNLVQQLSEAITTIINEKIYLPPEVATQFFRHFNSHNLNQNPVANLTQREQEVLEYLILGLSNEQISRHLYITVATVKAHLTAIFNKLGVKNRTQAIVAALKMNQALSLSI
jgi:DNA-binding NarL/FixJ family response regulator